MNNDQIEAGSFIEKEALKIENTNFIGKLLFFSFLYLVVTLLLNHIRVTAPIWLVWTIIVSQILLYFSIFSLSYPRLKVLGLNRIMAFSIPLFFAVLGRVNDWQILVIPAFLILMIVLSSRNKKLSEAGRNFQF